MRIVPTSSNTRRKKCRNFNSISKSGYQMQREIADARCKAVKIMGYTPALSHFTGEVTVKLKVRSTASTC